MKCPILSYGSPRERNPNVYLNDGVGRDTYISYNNGGNFSPEMRFMLSKQDRSTMKISTDQVIRSQLDPFPPSRIPYVPNGTGRDTYISDTLYDNFKSPRDFKCTLRQYQNISPMQKRILPPIMVAKQKERYETQKILLNRLTSPSSLNKLIMLKHKSDLNLNNFQ